MGTTRTRPPPTADLSTWIVDQSPHRQSEARPSHFLSPFEEMDVEDNEPRPAGRGPKRKRDTKNSEEEEEWEQEREEEREFEKRNGETLKRHMPLRTGRFHNPKCERCEKSGKSCEKQKSGVACYQCATRRKRCEPKGESGGKPRNAPIPTRTVVEKLALAPALRVAPQPSSPETAVAIPQSSSQSTQTRFVCDTQYYHESGDLAFVVEGTLFKVNTSAVSQTVLCKLPLWARYTDSSWKDVVHLSLATSFHSVGSSF